MTAARMSPSPVLVKVIQNTCLLSTVFHVPFGSSPPCQSGGDDVCWSRHFRWRRRWVRGDGRSLGGEKRYRPQGWEGWEINSFKKRRKSTPKKERGGHQLSASLPTLPTLVFAFIQLPWVSQRLPDSRPTYSTQREGRARPTTSGGTQLSLREDDTRLSLREDKTLNSSGKVRW